MTKPRTLEGYTIVDCADNTYEILWDDGAGHRVLVAHGIKSHAEAVARRIVLEQGSEP